LEDKIKKNVSGNLVIYTSLVCENIQCKNKEIINKQFEAPGIPYDVYIHESIKLTCPTCGSKYKDSPFFGVSPTDLFPYGGNGDGQDKLKSGSKPKPKSSLQEEKNREKENLTKAQLIIPAIEPHLNKLFTDEYSIPHAAIQVDDHIEVLKLGATRFKNWVRRTTYKENGSIIDNSTINDIIGILSAEAEFNPKCPTINLALRVANMDDSWYYDLTNKEWEFIKITPEGWYKVKNAILFHRYRTTPQVRPIREYPPDILDKFINLFNIQGDKNRLLLKCYIISLFIPGIPKVILNLHGEEGAAKTTLQELIKMLVDPSPMKTSSFLRDTNEFVQQLAHNYVMAYDNISIMRDWVSDLLCRVVTGSGFSKRELFTTDDDFIYTIMRCIMLNGITIAATKADLLDRSLIIQLKEIVKSKRRKVKDIWKEFDEIKAPLLGYILDVLVKVMIWKKENGSPGIQLSRMADWTEYAEIISRCMGYEDNELVKAYNENEGLQLDEVLNSNPVATVLIKYMSNLAETEPRLLELKLTATKWLNELKTQAETMGVDTRYKYWPKIASQLTLRLKELKKSLSEAGIEIEWLSDPKTKERNIRIRKLSSGSSGSSPNRIQARIFEHEKGNGDDGDDGDDNFPNYKENESEDETVFESDDDEYPSDYDDNEGPDVQ
jgi:hypothetical protein